MDTDNGQTAIGRKGADEPTIKEALELFSEVFTGVHPASDSMQFIDSLLGDEV